MILSKSSAQRDILSLALVNTQKHLLPFIPVCDLHDHLPIPYIPGSRIVEVDFQQTSSQATTPKKIGEFA